MLGVLRSKKGSKRGSARAPEVVAVPLRRVVVDGVELLVRRIIEINDHEVVYEDPTGTIRVLKRRRGAARITG